MNTGGQGVMHMEYIQGYIAQIAIPVKTVAYIHTKRAVMQKTWNMVNTFGQKKRGIKYEEKIQAYGKHFGVSKYSLV
jgi:hypothetical protein|tara:strand:+ start:493 stop:723 length:231 start_codon:yes stop_codon:yes gene_type:complete